MPKFCFQLALKRRSSSLKSPRLLKLLGRKGSTQQCRPLSRCRFRGFKNGMPLTLWLFLEQCQVEKSQRKHHQPTFTQTWRAPRWEQSSKKNLENAKLMMAMLLLGTPSQRCSVPDSEIKEPHGSDVNCVCFQNPLSYQKTSRHYFGLIMYFFSLTVENHLCYSQDIFPAGTRLTGTDSTSTCIANYGSVNALECTPRAGEMHDDDG